MTHTRALAPAHQVLLTTCVLALIAIVLTVFLRPVFYTTPVAHAATDTLVLTMSEDAYQGNALFNVTVDGKTIASNQTVTALHSNNKTQNFTYTGTWGSGIHTVAVTFIND